MRRDVVTDRFELLQVSRAQLFSDRFELLRGSNWLFNFCGIHYPKYVRTYVRTYRIKDMTPWRVLCQLRRDERYLRVSDPLKD